MNMNDGSSYKSSEFRSEGVVYSPGETMSFYGLVLRARSKSEICIGYKTKDEIVLNPPRKLEAVLSTESIEAVVVLAES